MRLSLSFGVIMLLGKGGAYAITGSAAIFSDAAESVVHIIAVSFAAFSLWLSTRPPDRQFTYGYERISFFSAGFEGGMITIAAFSIIYTAIQKWATGALLENLGMGVLIVAISGALNAGLGWFLVRTGRRTHSLILEANGKHVLADSWTSLGIVGGLILVLVTGWSLLDPVCAILVAIHILWSGAKLVWRSVGGLLDYSDPDVGRRLRRQLDTFSEELGIEYHGVRFRSTGHRLQVELHLLFPFDTSLGEAHRIATALEHNLEKSLDQPADIITHLESSEDHGPVHGAKHYTGRPGRVAN
jgi:cation diffusion facilitator family transporter